MTGSLAEQKARRLSGGCFYHGLSGAGWRLVHIPMGTLIDAPAIRPDRHLFVCFKAPWFSTDALPQYQEHTNRW